MQAFRLSFRKIVSVVFCLLIAGSLTWSTTSFEIPSRTLPVGDWNLESTDTPDDFSFIVYGDIQGNYQNGHNRLAERMIEEKAALVFNTGDISTDDGRNYDQTFYLVVEPLLSKKLYLPAPGNHDVLFSSPNSRSSFELFFGNVLGRLSRLSDNEHLSGTGSQRLWYSVSRGPALFIVLDSNWFIDEGRYTVTSGMREYRGYAEQQLNWLSALLKRRADVPYKFVFFHHSPIVSKEEGGFMGQGGHPGHSRMVVDLKTPSGQYVLDLFRQFGVTAVFTGHEHYYERWREEIVDSTGKSVRRLNWIVNGLGGVKPRGTPSYSQDRIRNVLERDYMSHYLGRISTVEPGWKSSLLHEYPNRREDPADFHNYALVHVSGPKVHLEIKDIDGRIRDRARLN